MFHINNDIKLNYKQLGEVLKALGYESAKTDVGQLVFLNKAYDSLLALRPARSNSIVPREVLAYIWRNIINKNVATESKIRTLAANV